MIKKLKKKTKPLITKKPGNLNEDILEKSSNFNKFEYFNEDLPEANDEQFVSLEELQEKEGNEDDETS